MIEQLRIEKLKIKRQLDDCKKELQRTKYKLIELEVINKRKLEFISFLSHEFKTPLNAIVGFSSLMQDENLSREKQIRYSNNIIKASKHLTQIVEYAIETAMAESDNMNLYIEEFNTSSVIKEVLCVLEEKIQEKHIELTTNIRKCYIRADKRRFRQLVYNLVSNAYKFNKFQGAIHIKTGCRKGNFHFEIKDTGCGIDTQKQQDIFKFFNYIQCDKYNAEGSGIGLTLCKKIINLHGGEIDFESTLGKGSVFRFYLPQDTQNPAEYMLLP